MKQHPYRTLSSPPVARRRPDWPRALGVAACVGIGLWDAWALWVLFVPLGAAALGVEAGVVWRAVEGDGA